MRAPTRNTERGAAMNMTPMIDVVFLLIIFFLVSSHLARQETQLEIDLPTAGVGEDPVESTRRRVTINVLPDGKTLLAGEPTDAIALTARLAYEQQQAQGDLQVRIRGDRAANYATIQPLLVACAKAGVWDVTFAVYSKTAVGNRESRGWQPRKPRLATANRATTTRQAAGNRSD